MTAHGPDDDTFPQVFFGFLQAWAASDRATSNTEQRASGHLRQVVFRFPLESGQPARLTLVAGLHDGAPVIEVAIDGYEHRSSAASLPPYADWEVALNASRRIRHGPLAELIAAADASAVRARLAADTRAMIAGLPEPVPAEMQAYLRWLGAP